MNVCEALYCPGFVVALTLAIQERVNIPSSVGPGADAIDTVPAVLFVYEFAVQYAAATVQLLLVPPLSAAPTDGVVLATKLNPNPSVPGELTLVE